MVPGYFVEAVVYTVMPVVTPSRRFISIASCRRKNFLKYKTTFCKKERLDVVPPECRYRVLYITVPFERVLNEFVPIGDALFRLRGKPVLLGDPVEPDYLLARRNRIYRLVSYISCCI